MCYTADSLQSDFLFSVRRLIIFDDFKKYTLLFKNFKSNKNWNNARLRIKMLEILDKKVCFFFGK